MYNKKEICRQFLFESNHPLLNALSFLIKLYASVIFCKYNFHNLKVIYCNYFYNNPSEFNENYNLYLLKVYGRFLMVETL